MERKHPKHTKPNSIAGKPISGLNAKCSNHAFAAFKISKLSKSAYQAPKSYFTLTSVIAQIPIESPGINRLPRSHFDEM